MADGNEVVVVRKVLVAEGARVVGGEVSRPAGGHQQTSPCAALTPRAAGWKIATGGDSDSSTDEEDF